MDIQEDILSTIHEKKENAKQLREKAKEMEKEAKEELFNRLKLKNI